MLLIYTKQLPVSGLLSPWCVGADVNYKSVLPPHLSLGAGAELKGDAVVGLRKIYIALARFIQCRLSCTVVDYVPAFRVKLGANDLMTVLMCR